MVFFRSLVSSAAVLLLAAGPAVAQLTPNKVVQDLAALKERTDQLTQKVQQANLLSGLSPFFEGSSGM